jgi:hypothetical protein
MLKDAKIHFLGILWFLFWRKKVAVAGLNRYIILWGQVGKGMESMPGEAVHIKLLPIIPPPINFMLSHILVQE